MTARKERPAGSLKTGEPAFLAAGKIRRPHGVQGEVLVELLTDFPERLKSGKTVYLGDKHSQVTIRGQRAHKDGLLLGFVGFNTPEEIGIFRNQILYVDKADSPELTKDEYYIHDLIDLDVEDENGNRLGTVTEVIETGANDVYVVTTPSGAELLLPAITGVILTVDLDLRKMTVHLLPGLMEENGDGS
jgi:16S rRNA processing protein RimM